MSDNPYVVGSTLEYWSGDKILGDWIYWAPNSSDFNVFYVLRTAHPAPWADDAFDAVLFNAYFAERSNNKIAAPIILYWRQRYNVAGAYLERPAIREMANYLWSMYGKRWTRMWDVYQYEYNPGENYDMLERMTNDTTVDQYGKTLTRTDNLQHAKTGTETTTPNTTETTTPNLHTSEGTKIFGFDSATGSDSDSTDTTATGTNTVQRTGTETLQHNVTDADTGTQTHAESGSDTHTRNYQLTRSGNIGVTTTQQMLQSDIDLWMWNYFENVVFADMDKVLTIAIY